MRPHMLSNMKIGSRILLALTLPILGLIFFSATVTWEKRVVFSQMGALQNLAAIAPSISGVVHELQRERGTSAVYIGSKGESFSAELSAQHKDSDQAITALNDALEA